MPKDKFELSELPRHFKETYGQELDQDFCIFISQQLSNNAKVDMDHLDVLPARAEANVFTANCFRNTILEEYHNKGIPIGDDEMEELMTESSTLLAKWLKMKRLLYENNEVILYNYIIRKTEAAWTYNWEK